MFCRRICGQWPYFTKEKRGNQLLFYGLLESKEGVMAVILSKILGWAYFIIIKSEINIGYSFSISSGVVGGILYDKNCLGG